MQRDGGVSTKGPRGGVFVMYNCARLHTLFDSYERGVEKGEGTLKYDLTKLMEIRRVSD